MTITLSLDDGTQQSFTKNEISVGCGSDCDFTLPAIDGIRDHHAIIRRIADRYLIESCGEWLFHTMEHSDDRRLWIHSGDLINLASRGPTLRVEFHADPQPKPAALPVNEDVIAPKVSLRVPIPSKPAALPVEENIRSDVAFDPQPTTVDHPPSQRTSQRLRRKHPSELVCFAIEAAKLAAGSILGIVLSYYIMCRFIPDSALLKEIAKHLPASLQPEAIRNASPSNPER